MAQEFVIRCCIYKGYENKRNQKRQKTMRTREIVFRGKDADNDHEWRYGSLLVCPGGSPVIVCFDDDGGELSYDVAPETVGQFAGLYDKNGKEIYEGDILREPETGILVEVVYDAPEFCFRHNAHEYRFLNHPENFEVVGNIHDNPGLLKGGHDGQTAE